MEKALGTVIDRFVDSQRDTEDKFLALEEKRMKFQLYLEERKREAEESIREIDRQHEMRLWGMMLQCFGNRPPYNHPPPSQYPAYQFPPRPPPQLDHSEEPKDSQFSPFL